MPASSAADSRRGHALREIERDPGVADADRERREALGADLEDAAELAGGELLLEPAHRRVEALDVADAERDSGRGRGGDQRLRLLDRGGDRLLDGTARRPRAAGSSRRRAPPSARRRSRSRAAAAPRSSAATRCAHRLRFAPLRGRGRPGRRARSPRTPRRGSGAGPSARRRSQRSAAACSRLDPAWSTPYRARAWLVAQTRRRIVRFALDQARPTWPAVDPNALRGLEPSPDAPVHSIDHLDEPAGLEVGDDRVGRREQRQLVPAVEPRRGRTGSRPAPRCGSPRRRRSRRHPCPARPPCDARGTARRGASSPPGCRRCR